MTPQQLKNSILQLAIQGKLVEQRKEEGTGEELYNVIQNEKKKLIEEGKLKKQKALPEITEEEVPFEVPENWIWVRLGQVCEIARGGSPRPIKDYITLNSDGINWIKIGDTNPNDKYINQTKEKIIFEGIKKSRMVYPGDFLLTNSMSFGRPYILNIKGCIHDGWLVISQSEKIFNKDFLYWMLSSRFAYEQFCKIVSGAVVKNLNSDKVSSSCFPLPPLAEQKRIVKKIEEILPLVERYEKAWSRLEELNKKFPIDMKKSILEHAIEGKLVEQREEEGTGEELFKIIQEEKSKFIEEGRVKKQRPLLEISEEEIPFEIPESWKWVRAGDILYITMGQSPKPESINNNKLGCEFHQGKSNFGEIFLNKSEVYTTADNKIIEVPAIVMSVRAPVGDVNLLKDKIYIGRGLASFQIYTECDLYYIYYYFLTIKNSLERVSTGSTFKAINSEIVKNIIIPLPPLAEQKRIVEKIEELLPLCENLKFADKGK